jgi:hypothetical protein
MLKMHLPFSFTSHQWTCSQAMPMMSGIASPTAWDTFGSDDDTVPSNPSPFLGAAVPTPTCSRSNQGSPLLQLPNTPQPA